MVYGGPKGQWNWAQLFQPLEDIILHKFIPALTGKDGISALERSVFALPVRLGGLGIINPVQQASHFYDSEASRKITSAPSSLLNRPKPSLQLLMKPSARQKERRKPPNEPWRT